MAELIEDFLTAIYVMKQKQSDSALAGKGYKWPLAVNITVRTFSDLSPSCTIKYGDQIYEGGFEAVLERATEWLLERGKE